MEDSLSFATVIIQWVTYVQVSKLLIDDFGVHTGGVGEERKICGLTKIMMCFHDVCLVKAQSYPYSINLCLMYGATPGLFRFFF